MIASTQLNTEILIFIAVLINCEVTDTALLWLEMTLSKKASCKTEKHSQLSQNI